jgi:macrolide transport system ATP-binding/permease protein
MFAAIRNTWRAIARRRSWESDLEDELGAHLEMRASDLVRRGMAPAAAERQARLEMGSRERYRDECRRSYGLRWLDEFRQDARYAVRVLRRSPAFTVVAVLSLALGIGANTVVFTFLNALILRPLPVERPDQLVTVMDNGGQGHSFPAYRELRDRNTSLAGLMGYRFAPMGLDTESGPRRVWGYLATGNYFDVLGVRPVIGRFFHAEDDRTVGSSPLAVLSYAAWQTRYGGDPAIAGRTVRINKLPYTILGVAPRSFIGTEVFYTPEIWVPMTMQPQIEGRASWLDNGAMKDTMLVGRLKTGAGLAQVSADLNRIGHDLAAQDPNDNAGMKLRLVKPGLLGDSLRGAAEAFLGGVMLLAGLVLLAACANLASLLAARATDRHFELAIRLSIGAGRGRVLRQLLTEAFILSLSGGLAGCALAFGALKWIAGAPAPAGLPVKLEFTPDYRVLLFALAASLVTGLVFGLTPARRAVKADPNRSLRGSGPNRNGQRRWALRDWLLAAQVALCCFLVTASFVSLRGLGRALETPIGIEPRQLQVAAFQLGLARYSAVEGAAFQKRGLDAVRRLPGVISAGYGNSIPLDINQNGTTVFPDRTVDFRGSQGIHANFYTVSPDYLRTIGTRVLTGRDFDWHDDQHSPSVAIVNQTFARQVMHTDNPVGGHFWEARNMPVEVIALVEDGKYRTLTESATPVVFRAAAQVYDEATVLVVRSALPDAEMARALRQTMTELDAQLPLYALGSVRQMVDLAYLPARAATLALGAFGVLALMLAITGIYGLAAYTVSRRVREIGIRIAVGARGWQVLWSVMGRIGVMLAAGSAAGLALGLASARLLASIVYQATPQDPWVLGGVGATMAVVALISAWIPARRAMSVDPIRSLRHE